MRLDKKDANRKTRDFLGFSSLYHEKPAIVAGFNEGFADEQKVNKNSAQNDFVSKAPLCKGRLGFSSA